MFLWGSTTTETSSFCSLDVKNQSEFSVSSAGVCRCFWSQRKPASFISPANSLCSKTLRLYFGVKEAERHDDIIILSANRLSEWAEHFDQSEIFSRLPESKGRSVPEFCAQKDSTERLGLPPLFLRGSRRMSAFEPERQESPTFIFQLLQLKICSCFSDVKANNSWGRNRGLRRKHGRHNSHITAHSSLFRHIYITNSHKNISKWEEGIFNSPLLIGWLVFSVFIGSTWTKDVQCDASFPPFSPFSLFFCFSFFSALSLACSGIKVLF